MTVNASKLPMPSPGFDEILTKPIELITKSIFEKLNKHPYRISTVIDGVNISKNDFDDMVKYVNSGDGILN